VMVRGGIETDFLVFLTAVLEGLQCSNSGYSHFTAGERTAVTTKY